MKITKERTEFLLNFEKLLEKYKKCLPVQDLAYDLIVSGGLMIFYHAPSEKEATQFIEDCLNDVVGAYKKLKERDGKERKSN